MRWSKLKQRIESNFADALQSRVALHSTAYGNCSCGHAWLTLDGEMIANFCTRASGNLMWWKEEGPLPLTDEQIKKYKRQPVDYGEISRQHVYQSCWEFIHDLSIDEALSDDDPMIQSLAVLDKRIGKRRLQKICNIDLHPLARKLLEVRMN